MQFVRQEIVRGNELLTNKALRCEAREHGHGWQTSCILNALKRIRGYVCMPMCMCVCMYEKDGEPWLKKLLILWFKRWVSTPSCSAWEHGHECEIFRYSKEVREHMQRQIWPTQAHKMNEKYVHASTFLLCIELAWWMDMGSHLRFGTSRKKKSNAFGIPSSRSRSAGTCPMLGKHHQHF